MKKVKIGFTGTQKGMNNFQKDTLKGILSNYCGEFHHGDCIGADTEAHEIACELGFKIIIHPPVNKKKRAFCEGVLLKEKPYLQRNKEIVNSVDLLIAEPRQIHEVIRSGTWATIRYAVKKGKNVYIIHLNELSYIGAEQQIK